MKAIYRDPNEIAELYINSGLKDEIDLNILINESAKQLMGKVGKTKAMNICKSFIQKKEILYTFDGLVDYINAVGIELINFGDPLTGKIENTVYVHIKK